MKLFIIALLNQAGVRPVTRSFLEDGVEASHGAGCAPDIIRETGRLLLHRSPGQGAPGEIPQSGSVHHDRKFKRDLYVRDRCEDAC